MTLPIASHDDIDQLLPWYVNNTLAESEREQVEQHLAQCPACRENVDFLSRIEDVVRKDAPSPLVPVANVDGLFDAVDAADRPDPRGSRPAWLAIAASIAAAAILGAVLMQRGALNVEAPQRFETATSSSGVESMQYIVEISFADGTSSAARREFLATIETAASPENIDADTVTLHIASSSLSELRTRVDTLREQPQVVAAEIVAVHLPVE